MKCALPLLCLLFATQLVGQDLATIGRRTSPIVSYRRTSEMLSLEKRFNENIRVIRSVEQNQLVTFNIQIYDDNLWKSQNLRVRDIVLTISDSKGTKRGEFPLQYSVGYSSPDMREYLFFHFSLPESSEEYAILNLGYLTQLHACYEPLLLPTHSVQENKK